VRTVTDLAHTDSEAATAGEPVALEQVAGDRAGRPGGKRFGALVHATLAVVDLDADDAQVRAATEAEGRLLGASEPEVSAAIGAANAALAHPLLRRAADADELRRETPVLMRGEDGSLIEGVVDLAFCERETGTARWTVVDFKTDADPTPHLAQYAAQLRLYAAAISAATGTPAIPVLLSI